MSAFGIGKMGLTMTENGRKAAILFRIESRRRLGDSASQWTTRPAALVRVDAAARATIGGSRARPSSVRRARGDASGSEKASPASRRR